MKHGSQCLWALALAAGLTACGNGEEWGEGTPTPADSLFLGYHLGMPADSFYAHSWRLNRQGLIMQGPMNQNVQYELDSALAHEATMLFYPDFFENKIARMRMQFSYVAWAPWNKYLFADSLLPEVVRLLTTWYGDGFTATPVRGPYGDPTLRYTKEDDHRFISAGVMDDREVAVLITDMRAQTKINAARDAAE